MKKFLFTAATLGALTLSAVAIASPEQPGVSFTFDVKSDGEFDLKVDAILAPGRTIEEARQILMDTSSMTAMSKIIVGAHMDMSGPDSGTLYTEWGRFHIDKQLVADCKETTTSSSWISNCSLRIEQDSSDPDDKGQTGALFASGGTITSCNQATPESNVHCESHSFGQAKAQRLLFLKVSPPHLALDGASFNLHDAALLLSRASSGDSISQTLNSYAGSPLDGLVQAMGDQMSGEIERIPSGRTYHASGDGRIGASSLQLKIQ